MVVVSERVGFHTTLGFLGSWPTNQDNQARVTVNQTLITAFGKSFDGAAVPGFAPDNVDAEHAEPGTDCYGCHQTLDPMREFFRRSYSYAYGVQDDPQALADRKATFVFGGMRADGDGAGDLATILASHPDLYPGWVQKVCLFANGARCPTNELFREIADRFAEHKNFKTMMSELLTSPLVANTDCVDGGTGHVRSIARRDQFCTMLAHRLEIDNPCGLGISDQRRTALQREISRAISSVPRDSFSRGELDPAIVTETSMFTRATRELICEVVATRAYASVFEGLSDDEAIQKMVSDIIGLPQGDPRHQPTLVALRDHVSAAVSQGASDQVARQSAFLVACMAPGLAGMGF